MLCGVGGGFTSGARSVAQAMEAEHCGAYGVVLNAPVSADILRDIKSHIDIPVVATIVSATQDTEARIAAGVDILNVSAASETPQLVAALRERHPEIPIIATGGPKDETIRKTIAAGAPRPTTVCCWLRSCTHTASATGKLHIKNAGSYEPAFFFYLLHQYGHGNAENTAWPPTMVKGYSKFSSSPFGVQLCDASSQSP